METFPSVLPIHVLISKVFRVDPQKSLDHLDGLIMCGAQEDVNTGMPYFMLQMNCICGSRIKNRMSLAHPISRLFSKSCPFLFNYAFFQFLEKWGGLIEFRTRLQLAGFPVGWIVPIGDAIATNLTYIAVT